VPKKFWSRVALRKALGMKPRAFNNWVARERLTIYRFSGRSISFDADEVAAAVARAAKRPPTPASGACSA